jgi:hypothetical protein
MGHTSTNLKPEKGKLDSYLVVSQSNLGRESIKPATTDTNEAK